MVMVSAVKTLAAPLHNRAAGLALGLLLAPGCATEEVAGPSVDDLAQQVAQLECAERFANGCETLPWTDEQACQDARVAELAELYAQAEQMGRTYDSACAQSLFGASQIPYLYNGDCASPCNLFHGDKAEGESCDSEGLGSDCQGSLECYQGTCRPITDLAPLQEGDPCVDVELAFCGEGLLCDDRDSEVCIVAPAEGETCMPVDGTPLRCGFGHFCDFDQQICRATIENGQPCAPGNGAGSCQSFTCENDLCVPHPTECEALTATVTYSCR